VSFVFWFPIAVGRRVPLQPGRPSRFPEATNEEIAAINDGSVIEEYDQVIIPSGSTATQVKAALEARYAAREAVLTALPNPNQFFGIFWDGSTWSA